MLDKNLEEVDDQYNLALRNHLIQIDRLVEIRNSRTDALKSEFDRSSKTIYDEFHIEAKEIKKNHLRQLKELGDMMECVNNEEKEKLSIMREAFQTALEQSKQKAKEEIEVMQNDMRSKQGILSNYLETLYQRYMNDTKEHFSTFTDLLKESSEDTKIINDTMKTIARTKARIELMKLKITQMENEFEQRNNALENEKDAINRNQLELKAKMARFRNGKTKEKKSCFSLF